MSLRHRKDKETYKLKGVDRSIKSHKLEFGKFFALENWIPGGVHSIKRKRGVEPLITESIPIEPRVCEPPECLDSTHIGQQDFAFALWNANESLGGNTRTSWGYIADGEAYTLTGQANCGPFGNMPYSNDPGSECCQITLHSQDGTVTTRVFQSPNLPGAPTFSGASTCKIGQSDEPLVHIDNGQDGFIGIDAGFVYPLREIRVDPDLISGFNINAFGAWCKEGEDLYLLSHHLSGGTRFQRYPAFSQLRPVPATITSDVLDHVVSFQACTVTEEYVYALVRFDDDTDVLYRVDRDTLSNLTEIVDITGLDITGMHAKTDGTVWLFGEKSLRWPVYYWNGSEVVYVGAPGRPAVMGFGNSGMHFSDRRIYVGARGTGGLAPGIYKTDLPCDEDESIFAEVSAGAASVAAGADIAANWADFLIPNANDRIHVRPAPANAHDPGFVGTATTTATTGGGSSGSINITIPGGTTPGQYILQLVLANGVYVCRSAPFTVT